MSHIPQEEPFSEAHLNSPEYRERLMRKLNCLIAVLEVATAKVKRSLAEPSSETERLTRICANLQSTLDVCLRARTALERRPGISKPLPGSLEQAAGEAASKAAPGSRPAARRAPRKRDERSAAEKRRFGALGPIDRGMIGICDLDELARRLQG